MSYKFNPAKLSKLNNPVRMKDIPPRYVWEILNLKSPETIVDIGAGTGFFTVPLLEMMDRGKAYACDTAPEMIEWMNVNILPENPFIETVLLKDETLPLPEDTADLVFMINLHHELDSPVKTLKESLRVLKTGGKILIIDWKKIEMSEGPPVEHRIRDKTVKEQLQRAGFSCISTDTSLEKHYLITAQK